jgi:hypothetical protein
VTPGGALIGSLPPVPVATPWWQDIAPVVEAVMARHGIEITVLRLLQAAEPAPPGGEVTYLAETGGTIAADAWDGVLDEHPLRLPWARPGGPALDLAWATDALARAGLAIDAAPIQVRTWNLSSLWRLRAGGRTFWLKVTPPFMDHEGAVLEALTGGPVPSLIAHDGARILAPEIPGEDCYEARGPVLSRMVDLLVGLQSHWLGRTDALLALGLNDWRPKSLAKAIGVTFERNADDLDRPDRDDLSRFVDLIDRRFEAVTACGVPDSLVHGDFSPGNLRFDGTTLTLLDWGDCGVGCPLLDQAAFLDRVPAEDIAALKARWHAAWSRAAPGSDPARASDLLAPIAMLRQAVIYQGFLDGIEPSEHPYHRADPADRLRRAADLIRREAIGAPDRAKRPLPK